MFKHILVPTDGSRLSQKAVRKAAALARAFGARLTGVYVSPPYPPPVYGEAMAYVPEVSRKRFDALMRKEAAKALAVVEIEAKTSGVDSRKATVTESDPWRGILRAAASAKCDLIVMASHGRRGLAGLLLGSETVKVLTHSKIPVLVCR
jgi:nucleotide-binding universal stress UspA family protein